MWSCSFHPQPHRKECWNKKKKVQWLWLFCISGYRVSPQALNAIIKRYNKGGRIFFDDYVACCVKLRALTGKTQSRDQWRTEITQLLCVACGFSSTWNPRRHLWSVVTFRCFIEIVLWAFALPVTDNFRRRDTMHQGSVNFQYDDVSPPLTKSGYICVALTPSYSLFKLYQSVRDY